MRNNEKKTLGSIEPSQHENPVKPDRTLDEVNTNLTNRIVG